MRYSFLPLLLTLCCCSAYAQSQDTIPPSLKAWAENYWAEGMPKAIRNKRQKAEIKSYRYDTITRTVYIGMSDLFGSQQWTPATPQLIYSKVRQLLPDSLRGALVEIRTLDRPIEHLAPYAQLDTVPRLPEQDYNGNPWVKNLSLPYSFENGLGGRHIAIAASHGGYWNRKEEKWDWQRPLLFDTHEDLLTPMVANELVIPMLEAAGAVVWSPRERCPASTEIITDNDVSETDAYVERDGSFSWMDAGAGFAPIDTLRYGDNPFTRGTARKVFGMIINTDPSTITWYPDIKAREVLAVYVSYKSLEGSTEGAIYTIRHGGIDTRISVNQSIGGSTWVYLGSYLFTPNDRENNRITLTNYNKDGGIVTADAIRLGGGMGNVLRGDTISGLTRYDEGARYSMQWAGMPDTIYSYSRNEDDYKDDINSRSLSMNHLAGGSIYCPDTEGLGVPLELSVAIHTDAGIDREGIIGSLGIATTRTGDYKLASGCSRLLSRDLAEEVLTSVCRDMAFVTGKWNRRELWDRNYSETRTPVIPSTIIEMLSHQNENDMRVIMDESHRFHLARAIYKGILRFIYNMHGIEKGYVVQPLPVKNVIYNNGILSWTPVSDPLEPSAISTHYMVQLAIGDQDFDNGTILTTTSCRINAPADKKVALRVTAINAGGASLPVTVVANN